MTEENVFCETANLFSQTGVVEYFRKQFVAQQALAVYQNFLYSF